MTGYEFGDGIASIPPYELFKMRGDYLQFIVHHSTFLSHRRFGFDLEIDISFREKLSTWNSECLWLGRRESISFGATHDLSIDLQTTGKSGFEPSEIAHFVWSLFETLRGVHYHTIIEDETRLNPDAVLEIPALEHFTFGAAEEWGTFDPRPFAGDPEELEYFKDSLWWWSYWHRIDLTLTYPTGIDLSFGTHTLETLFLSEGFYNHERVDPARFDPSMYLARLEANGQVVLESNDRVDDGFFDPED